MTKPCHCPSYSWPHRKGGGSCIWSRHRDEPLCEECGKPCKWDIAREDPDLPESLNSTCCQALVVQAGGYLTANTQLS